MLETFWTSYLETCWTLHLAKGGIEAWGRQTELSWDEAEKAGSGNFYTRYWTLHLAKKTFDFGTCWTLHLTTGLVLYLGIYSTLYLEYHYIWKHVAEYYWELHLATCWALHLAKDQHYVLEKISIMFGKRSALHFAKDQHYVWERTKHYIWKKVD